MVKRDRTGGLDGVVVIAKPSGPTSHDVVGLVRRLSGTPRVGHGGTLDPFAAGVLAVFLGRATRLTEYHLSAPKRYRATFCFGENSTTDDIDGQRTPVDGPLLVLAALKEELIAMTGPMRQVPPDYSAVQVGGRRAYRMARSGEAVDLPPRDVVIEALDLLEWDDTDPRRPMAVVDVRCSAGTYVRAIARDLGARLGTGAYLGALVRTASGSFRLEDAMPLEVLREHAADGPAGVASILRPIDAGLEDVPHARVTRDEVRRFGEGLPTGPKMPLAVRDMPLVLAVGPDGTVVAVCRAVGGILYPTKVLAERPATAGRPDPRPDRVAHPDPDAAATEAVDGADAADAAASDI